MVRFYILVVLGLSLFFSKESQAQKVWTSRSTPFLDNSTWRIYSNANKIIARVSWDFAPQAYFTSSNDGIYWSPVITDNYNTTNVQSVVWTGSQFVGIVSRTGDGMGFFATSPDGIFWTQHPSGDLGHLTCLTWTGTELLAGDDSGSIYTSENGISWTVNKTGIGYNRTLHQKEPIYAITYTGSLYFASGLPDIFTSSDGKKWTRRAMGGDKGIATVIHNGHEYIAVFSGGSVLASPDGATWSTRYTTNLYYFENVLWNGSKLVASVGDKTVASSSDGNNWTNSLFDKFPPGEFIDEMTWTGKQFCAVGSSGTIATSMNGNDWTIARYSEKSLNFYAVAASKFQNVAVGSRGAIYTSPDGIVWNAQESGTTKTLRAIIWSGTEFITVGDSGTILTSPTGRIWTNKVSGTLAQLKAVDWVGSQYLIGGAWGTLLSSPDGNIWTAYKPLTAQSINAIKGNGTSLVAVGDSGLILSSLDGVNWIRRLTPKASPFRSLVWTGYQFVAAGGSIGDYQVFTSLDGERWSWSGSMKAPGDLRSMAVKGDEVVALFLGSSSSTTFVRASKDGTTWYASDKSPMANSITWTGNQFILVGNGKSIFTSPSSTPTEITQSTTDENGFYIRASHTSLSITLPADLRQEKSKVSIYNLSGHRIMERALVNTSGQISIPLPEMSKGRYLLEVTGSKRKFAKSFCLIQ